MGRIFLKNKLKAIWHDEAGATAIEYALIIALIATAIATIFTNMGMDINGSLNNLGDTIERQDLNTGEVD